MGTPSSSPDRAVQRRPAAPPAPSWPVLPLPGVQSRGLRSSALDHDRRRSADLGQLPACVLGEDPVLLRSHLGSKAPLPRDNARGVFESSKAVTRDERHSQPGHQPCLTVGTPPSTPGSAAGKFTRYSQAACWVLALLMQK